MIFIIIRAIIQKNCFTDHDKFESTLYSYRYYTINPPKN